MVVGNDDRGCVINQGSGNNNARVDSSARYIALKKRLTGKQLFPR
jgi:hypothetical protein